MKRIIVTDIQRKVIIAALHIAAEKHTQDAKICDGLRHELEHELKEQFNNAAQYCLTLAEYIENAEEVRI